MAEPDTDLAEVLLQFTNLIMNERVRSYNEGVDAERARCAAIADDHASAECNGIKDQTAAMRLGAQSIAEAIRVPRC